MQQSKLGTMFMNPSWWVKAYEVSASSKAPHLSPLELSCDSGLTPALNPIELSALGIVLSNIQKQLLAGGKKVILDPVQHRKFVSSTSRNRIFSFERILQILTGMRLLSGNRDEGFDVISLFQGESWNRKGFYNGLVIELDLAPLGSELIFGLAEPYSELERLVCKKHRAQRHLGSNGPLGLWQSIWLDLQGLEQMLVMRIEKSMQWENRWLRLDGVFGSSFSELFKNLELPKPRGKSSDWSEHRIKQRVLERMGRKLLEHGLLSFELDDEFLAMDKDVDDFSLIWQAGPEYLSQLDSSLYGAAVGNYLRDHVFQENLTNIIITLTAGIYNEELGLKLAAIWQEILSGVSKDDYCGVIHNNLPIMASSLFFEFYVRQLAGHQFPLPESSHSTLFELANPNMGQPVSERYSLFKNHLKEENSILQDLETVPGLSLVSPRTQSDSEAYSYFVDVQRVVAKYESTSVNFPIQEKAEVSKQVKSVPKVPVEPASRPLQGVQLKKTAGEVLAQMRSSSPQKYGELKRAYINTLDAEKKKIIVEVMERLQPKTFDDHLKNSLIKYMVENPGVWLPSSTNQLSSSNLLES